MKKRAKSKTVVYELKPDQPLTARQKREIQALAAMRKKRSTLRTFPSFHRKHGRKRFEASGIAL